MSTKDEDTTVVDQPSFLEMSDEDMLKAPPPALTSADTESEVDDVSDAGKDAEKDKDEGAADADADADDDKKDDADSTDEAGDSQAEEGEAGKDKDKIKDKPADETKDLTKEPGSKDADKTKEAAPPKEAAPINYEAEYKRLLAPFKANGRDIQVESVDDAIALMQMGANYNKKMAALKPNLKLMKMLENNGFMSEEKIGFLIDLGKKDPAAINKLVKDSGLDPMDLDPEKAKAYKQTTYAVDDREIELDTVLDDLQGTPTYTRTLDVVSNKWDVASKQTVSQNPQLLKVINDHIASGIYDLISTEVERGRMLGRLNGLSDIEAYRQVGDAIQARGGFNHLSKPQIQKPDTQAPVIVPPKPKKVEDDKLKDKRRAASSTQPAAPRTDTLKDFNPLSMSDEEFSKMATPKFV